MNSTTSKINTDNIQSNVKDWNWGAFFLTWIWGLANKTYISLIALIPGINIIMAFILGAKGSKWAAKNKTWKSTEQFKRVQENWSFFGWGIFAGFLSGLILVLLVVGYIVSSVFL